MSDVRDHGAKGDGTSDDTPALRHALENHDGVLGFPPGTYRLTSPLRIELDRHGPVALRSLGGVATLEMIGSGPAVHVVGTHAGTADPAHQTDSVRTRERLPLVADLEIRGGHPEADGILLEGCWQPNLLGLSIRGTRHAVRLTGRMRNVVIDRCHVYHNRGVGVFLDRVDLHQINVTGNHISYNRDGGIRIVGSEVRNLQIVGNDIEYDNAAAHADAPDSPWAETAEILIDCRDGGSVREVTISGNTLQATALTGGYNVALFGSRDVDHRVGMLTITGNLIGSQETNLCLVGCRGVVVGSNYIYGAERRNILIDRSANIVLSGNCIGANPDYARPDRQVGVRLRNSSNVTIGSLIVEGMPPVEVLDGVASREPAEALLEVEDCRFVGVSNSQFLDSPAAGILVRNSSHVSFDQCSVVDRATPPRMTRPLRWSGPGTANRVADCLLDVGMEGGATIDPDSQVVERH